MNRAFGPTTASGRTAPLGQSGARRNQSLSIVFGVAALAALASCRKQPKPEDDPAVVAMVNGEVIGRADFEEELSRELQTTNSDAPLTPEQVDPLKRSLLQTLIDRALLVQVAKQKALVISPEEVDRGMLRITSDYPAEGLDEALNQGSMSASELKQKTATLLLIEKLFQSHVYPRVGLTEEEIRRYYEEHREEFQEPEQVRAAQIVVKGLDEAKRIQAQLRQGKKFADLARKYSLSADAKVGGDLGFFPRGMMPPEFDEVAFRLGVGQVSDVVATDYGFHLFRILEKKPARKKELNEVRKVIEEKLLKTKQAEAESAFLTSLKSKADVKVNEKTLQAVTGKQPTPGGRFAEP